MNLAILSRVINKRLIALILLVFSFQLYARDPYKAVFKNADITKCIKLIKAGKHKNQNDIWIDAIKDAEIVHRNYDDKNYPELCFWIGKEIQASGDFKTAYYYLYKTLSQERDNSKEYIALFHDIIGHNYYNFMRYDLAEKHILKSVNNKFTPENSKISLYNTLGLIYRNRKNNIKSELYFRKAYNLAEKQNHEPWLGVLSGNLGLITLRNGKIEEAKKLITYDFKTGIEHGQYESAYFALASLIEIDIRENNLQRAKSELDEIDSALQKVVSNPLKLEYYRVLINYQTVTGDYKGAYDISKLASALKDTLSVKRDALQLFNIESQISVEKKEAENFALNELKKKDKFRIASLLTICFILLLSGVIVVTQILKRRAQERKIQELQRIKIQEELRITELELKALLQTSINKSKIIEELQGDVEEGQAPNIDPNKIELIEKLQSFSLLTDEDWISFKNLFEKLNPNFFIFFRTKYVDVTVAEIRLAALIKLNLTTNEMAHTLGISPDSVRKTNLRLRKKIGIETTDDLFQFIYKMS